MDDDDESVCLQEYDIDCEYVKYHTMANACLSSLMKDNVSQIIKEYATRKLRNSDNINRPIDQLMLTELKTIINSGRLIMYNFLDVQMKDGG